MQPTDGYEDGATEAAFELRGRQLALQQALGELHPPLADWYGGAMRVLSGRGPDHFALVAHNFREILEYLPRLKSVPLASANTTLGSKAKELCAKWAVAVEKTACMKDGKWGGEIDRALARLLVDLEEFVAWVGEQRPTQKVQAARLVRSMDPLPLPELLVDQNAEWYHEMRGFFVGVAHHGDCPDDDFKKWTNAFEIFLLDRLRPRTDEDFEKIDKIIAGGSDAIA